MYDYMDSLRNYYSNQSGTTKSQNDNLACGVLNKTTQKHHLIEKATSDTFVKSEKIVCSSK